MRLYLYGIVTADAQDPPAELMGLDDGSVRLVRAGAVAGIVGEVDPESYAAERLDSRLAELEWVGERGIAHERVLTWYADRGPVIPLQPFSLHVSDEAVRQRLAESEERFVRALERLSGRQEWGIKLWAVEPDVLAHLEEISPALREVADAMESAPPGRRFLLTKKRDAMAADELRASSLAVARHVYDTLAELADAAVRHPIPPPRQGDRMLILHAAYLVRESDYDRFRERVVELSRHFGTIGFSCEFVGPWPAYHFTDFTGA
jgi:hypothetical protein